MKISNRLIEVSKCVTPGYRVADIGTDHGYVPIYLMDNKLASYVIAMDVNKGPLERAEINIRENGYEDVIETRLSNGFEKLNVGETDIAVIAGMGGELIKKILIEGKEVVDSLNELVLSPHSDIDAVRKYLHEIGFRINYEKMLIDEEKFYTILKVQKGKDKDYSEVEYKYGAILLDNKDLILKEFLTNQLNKYILIEKRLINEKTDNSIMRLKQIQNDIQEIKGILEKY